MLLRRSFHTIMNKKDNIRPLIFIDFDETLTTKDTISILGQFSINQQLSKVHSINSIPTSWSYFTNTYLKDYQQVNEKQQINSSSLLDNIKESIFLKEEPFRKVEQASLDRIAFYNVLKGFTSIEIQQAGANQVELRPCCDTIFNNNEKNEKKKDLFNRLYIVSLNWSKDWIFGALNQHHSCYLDKSHILSNDLEFDPITHQSTGKILPSILLSNDKLKIIQSILFQHQQKMGVTGTHKIPSIYIGDSMGDLLPLIECDIGIVIGYNEKLLATLKQLGILIQEDLNKTIDEISAKVIYRVDDWETILNSSLIQ